MSKLVLPVCWRIIFCYPWPVLVVLIEYIWGKEKCENLHYALWYCKIYILSQLYFRLLYKFNSLRNHICPKTLSYFIVFKNKLCSQHRVRKWKWSFWDSDSFPSCENPYIIILCQLVTCFRVHIQLFNSFQYLKYIMVYDVSFRIFRFPFMLRIYCFSFSHFSEILCRWNKSLSGIVNASEL